jgi:hypothetical protein
VPSLLVERFEQEARVAAALGTRATVSLDSVNLPPRVTMETYSIPDVLCPRSEIRFDLPLLPDALDPRFGRD